MSVGRRILLALVASTICLGPLGAQNSTLPDAAPAPGGRIAAVTARHGMVVAQEARAARIGIEILRQGGNAVDAAVATGFALAVTYPRAGNIGGGGYMLVHLASRNIDTAIDYRETAPAATTPGIFLDERGEADPHKSRDSALAIGVPGTVAGLSLAHAKYGSGKFTLAQLIAPAIQLAREGIPIEDDTADSLPRSQARLARWPSTMKIFFADGRVLAPGATLVQSDLADTLAAIAESGPEAFYEGATAEKIVAAVRAAGGLMTRDDLKNYRVVEHAPVRGRYRGYDVLSMPPSSSGGVILIEMLNILEGYPDLAADDARRLHLMIEAMKLAYADRATFLGDPASVDAPLARLLSKNYAAKLRARIDAAQARPARDIYSGGATLREGDNTTHFSVVDRFGNAVSNTTTLNFSYGLGLVADGTGILLNNELDDFAAKPGVPNAFGLVGRRGQRPGTRQAPAVIHDANHRAQERQAVHRHRLTRRQPHHHRGAAGDPQRDRPQAFDRGRGRGAAHPSSMVARRGHGRTRIAARPDPRTGGTRSHRGGAFAADLGQFDPGHHGRPRRRARQPHPRRAGRGLLGRVLINPAL